MAARSKPRVRMKRSVGSAAGPSTSASRPAPSRRRKSICHSRSWACTKPCAKIASSKLAASMCGTAWASRTMLDRRLEPRDLDPAVDHRQRLTQPEKAAHQADRDEQHEPDQPAAKPAQRTRASRPAPGPRAGRARRSAARSAGGEVKWIASKPSAAAAATLGWRVVDIDAALRRMGDPLEQQLEDARVRLDQALVARDQDGRKALEEGEARAGDRKGLGRPVGERVQLVAGRRQLLEDRDAALDRARDHLVPAARGRPRSWRAGRGGAAPPPRSHRRRCGRDPAPGSRPDGRPPRGTTPSERRRRTACDRDGADSSRSARRPDRTRSPACPALRSAIVPAMTSWWTGLSHGRKVWRKSARASTPSKGMMSEFAPQSGLCQRRRASFARQGLMRALGIELAEIAPGRCVLVAGHSPSCCSSTAISTAP